MRPTRSRTITSLLAAVGAGFAVSAMIGAPTAVAQVLRARSSNNRRSMQRPRHHADTSLRLPASLRLLAALGSARRPCDGQRRPGWRWRPPALTPLNRHVQNPGPSDCWKPAMRISTPATARRKVPRMYRSNSPGVVPVDPVLDVVGVGGGGDLGECGGGVVQRMSRVPWNFGGGPVSIRLRSRRDCCSRVRQFRRDMPFQRGPEGG